MTKEMDKLIEENRQLKLDVHRYQQDVLRYQDELQKANVQLEGLIERLNKDVRTMQRLQQVLVPTEFPNISGFEFSTKFIPSPISGGDYIDIFQHENKFKFGVIMSSASGYGMSALMLSAFLNLTGQLEARRGGQPDKMMKLIADDVLELVENDDRYEVFYALVDQRKFELHYCLQGDINAFHWDSEKRELHLLNKTGESLSAGQEGPYKKEKVALNSKDRCIVCSPGLIEMKNIDDETYGLQRLMRSIRDNVEKPVHELRNEIIFQLEQFSQGVETKSDLSVIVAEVKEKVLKLA